MVELLGKLASPSRNELLPLMNLFEIVVLGIALSADAMSVTLCNIIANPRISRRRAALIPLTFGALQGIMPLIGYLAGFLAVEAISAYAGIITFGILGIIGAKMAWDGIHEDSSEDEEAVRGKLSVPVILVQAIATSIDALAVGISLAAGQTNIVSAAGIIALSTFLLCGAMIIIGRCLDASFGRRAQIVGGIVLILLGAKAFFF